MRLFCPNCGSDNEGNAGTRVTCRACAATFEAPRGEVAPVPPPPAQPQTRATPASQGWVADTAQPSRPPPPFISPMQTRSAAPTSPLAIASLVTGILCCLPFSIAALVTGFMAIKQIDDSHGAVGGRGLAIAGIVLGFLALGVNCLGIVSRFAG